MPCPYNYNITEPRTHVLNLCAILDLVMGNLTYFFGCKISFCTRQFSNSAT